MIDTIRDKELTVSQLVDITGINQANVSQHLSILRSKGVVQTRRNKNNIYYSLADLKIIKAYDLISEVLRDSIIFKDQTIKKGIN